RVDARLGHRAVDGDALGGELLDEHRHLRVLEVLLAVQRGDMLFDLLLREAGHRDGADEGQGDEARRVDTHRALAVLDVQDLDVEQVVGADAVFLTEAEDGRGLLRPGPGLFATGAAQLARWDLVFAGRGPEDTA